MSPPRNRLPAPLHHPSTRQDGQAQKDSWRACGSPRMSTWTGRRSSSSATRTAREHNHEIVRSPARTFEAAHPACAGLGGDLRTGLGPRPPRRPSTPGDTGHPRRCKPFGVRATALPGASRGFTSQGPAGSRRPTPLAAARKQATELCPDPIRSGTSRHETTAVPEGEPDTGRRSAEADRRTSCDLASQADPRANAEDVGLGGLHTARFREAGGSSRPDASRLRSSRPSTRAGRTGLLAQTDATGAKGRLSRTSAKKPEIRCTRGAFH